MSVPNNLILYHYDFSPISQRVRWYLTLRGLPHAECPQPIMLPRPDLQALGVEYRRMPVLAHGNSIFCDSRLIISYLESAFPGSNIAAETPEQLALQKLLEGWIIDDVFPRATQSLPADLPLMQDPKFVKDREQYTGRSWGPETVQQLRPEGLVHLQKVFAFLETGLLADGREWLLNTDGPKLADLEAAWLISWLIGLKVVLPKDIFSAQKFPKVFGWVSRFKSVIEELDKRRDGVPKLNGEEATKFVKDADKVSNSHTAYGIVDDLDPTGLREGTIVESWPSDTGMSHRDRGRLVGLNQGECILKSEQGVYIHHPRWNYKLRAVNGESAKI